MAHDEGLVNRHESEFTRIWQQVCALGNRMTAVEGTVDRLDEDMYNHGRDGLKTQFTAFLSEFRSEKKAREEHSAHMMNLIVAFGVIVGFLALVVAWLTYIDTKGKIDKGLLRIPQFTLSDSLERVYAKNNNSPQNAELPNMR